MGTLDEVGRSYQDINAVVFSITGSSTTPQVIDIPVVEGSTGINLPQSTLAKYAEQADFDEFTTGVLVKTSSNTDISLEAMTHIKLTIDRALLWLACRHLMAELYIKPPYEFLMHEAAGLDDPLFKTFQSWFIEQKHLARNNEAIFISGIGAEQMKELTLIHA